MPDRQRFKKILVANRGEIAIRVLRAASELKLRTVSIYTYEDRYSLHRYKSDEAYQIGNNDEPLRPYLDIEEIIRVAKANQIEAIHPGYGFLSENVQFARRCREEGIIFIGPTPEVMDQLGDKVAAKLIAGIVNVPMIPDSHIAMVNKEEVLSEALRIGFPVMVKAVAGGGGRGMRVVRKEEDLIPSYNEARGEAKNAFGNDTVFLEKFIEYPKHIEVQLLGDKYGNLVHLFERDCSVQRRFQKVVEIAPSLTLQQSTKDKLYEYALRIGRHVGYSNAGTVEFLVDRQENIYFIEVNPRIQVEHTITEEITGIDIVRSQILIAMGYELSHPTLNIGKQEDIECSGFAIQCRITTEDPAEHFKPDYGALIAYRSAGGFGIRLDAGSAYAGANISPFFDSMLVKVTGWGRTFTGAADRLLRALSEFRIRGVKTNFGFLENMLHDPTFRKGECTVNFIQDNPQSLPAAQQGPPVNERFPLGRYIEDNEFVTGLGDLDAFNGRTTVTPEYPTGTYAYFVTINDDGSPAFPYILGLQYYGTASQSTPGAMQNVPTDAADYFNNGGFTGQPSATDPLLKSLQTRNSQTLARAIIGWDPSAGPQTTWPGTQPVGARAPGGGVTTPANADLQRIRTTATSVFLNSNNLPSYVIGPWFAGGMNGGVFMNWAASTNSLAQLPRAPQPATIRRNTGLGTVGVWVNGVAIFNAADGASYRVASNDDLGGGIVVATTVNVSAASLEGGPVTPGTLVTAYAEFEAQLATATEAALNANWPHSLGGTTVTVVDCRSRRS